MAGVLVYSERPQLILELVSAAHILTTSPHIYLLTLNNEVQAAELAAKGLQVCNLNGPGLNLADTAALSMAVKMAADQLEADLVLLASNRRGKELAGRLAQSWSAGCLTDIKTIALENDNPVFTRNALNGATIATQLIKSEHKVAAVSPRSFPVWNENGEGSVRVINAEVEPTVELLETKAKAGDADIQAADRLLVVGQGVENQEDLKMIEAIARALKAEVACSKPVATDRKWFPEDRIIGLSGKICKPELVITLGVSGQVQFMVGIRDSKVIVSINNDENADLNKMADYVLVEDLNQVLPKLAGALGKN
jgi:Electron transfer flavoprotein, alpha subunit